MIFIRRATILDAPIIASLGRITFTETFGELFTEPELEDYLVETFSVEKILSSLEKNNNIYWIAHLDENPVGYAKIKVDYRIDDVEGAEQIQLQKIYVLKEYLDKKIGSPLLNEIMKSEELKTGSILWLVVLYTNVRAIKFYEKSGFRKLREHYHKIGTKNFKYELMIKEL